MKKLLVLTLTLLLPLAVFAQGNKQNKEPQDLKTKNEKTLQQLFLLGKGYNITNKNEQKEKISKSIDKEIDQWYSLNMQTIIQAQEEKAAQDGVGVGDLSSEENVKKTKKELADEIKKAKIPELMYSTVSEYYAEQLKKNEEIFTKKMNKIKSTTKPVKILDMIKNK